MAIDQFMRGVLRPDSDSDFYPFKKDRKKRIIQIAANASMGSGSKRTQKGNTVAKEMILINQRLERKKPEELVGKKGVSEIHQVIKETSKRRDDDA